MLKLFIPVLCICCGSMWAMTPQDAATPAAKTVSAEEASVNEILKVYTEVYNKHDAAALAEYWASDAVSVNSETGSRMTGRTAIKAGFEQLFKNEPKSKLTIRLKHFRFIKPEMLSIEGESMISTPNEEPAENAFTAMLTRAGDKWQIEHATESPIPVPSTPYDALKTLEWLVGTWVDDSQEAVVETQITWNPKKTFLIRKYSAQFAGETEVETGTQIIGWDARSKSIRSWTFSSDGSFGEGAWTFADNDWRIKFNHTTSDGSLMSGTQVLTRIDNHTASVQMIGQEVDGDLGPSKPPVKMLKKSDSVEEPKK